LGEIGKKVIKKRENEEKIKGKRRDVRKIGKEEKNKRGKIERKKPTERGESNEKKLSQTGCLGRKTVKRQKKHLKPKKNKETIGSGTTGIGKDYKREKGESYLRKIIKEKNNNIRIRRMQLKGRPCTAEKVS